MGEKDFQELLLTALYAAYADFIAGFPCACEPGCAACCTPNVVITSLEAAYILDLEPDVIEKARRAAARPLYRPASTINHLAVCCLAARNPPEDHGEHVDGICVFLDERKQCSIYARRPFACRAMFSRAVCRPGTEALMPAILMTVNLAMHQIIEHLDSGGYTGSMPDLLLAKSEKKTEGEFLLRNHKLPGFLIPPEEEKFFKIFLNTLVPIRVGEKVLGDYLPNL